MDGDLITAIVSRWLHVGTAVVLVGGTTVLRFVVHPVISGAEAADGLLEQIRSRWKRFVHGGIGLLLLSGFFNYFRALPLHKGDGVYHMLIGIKILLAFLVFFLASALVGRSASTQKIRDEAKRWSLVIIGTSFLIVAISGIVKVRSAAVPAPASPEALAGDSRATDG